MKSARLIIPSALLALAALFFGTTGAQAAVAWSSSDQWGSWTNGGYTLYNDIWGSGAGPQTLFVDSTGTVSGMKLLMLTSYRGPLDAGSPV